MEATAARLDTPARRVARVEATAPALDAPGRRVVREFARVDLGQADREDGVHDLFLSCTYSYFSKSFV